MQKAMQLKQIGADVDTQVQTILSPEQYQKWQEMRAAERQQAMQKMEQH
jgi:hypothetical protein